MSIRAWVTLIFLQKRRRIGWSFSARLRLSSGVGVAAPAQEGPEENAEQADRADGQLPGDDVDIRGVDSSGGFLHHDADIAARPREFHGCKGWGRPERNASLLRVWTAFKGVFTMRA